MGTSGASSEDKGLLRQEIFAEHGFYPNAYEMMGEFSSSGWTYRGVGEVNCHHGGCDRPQQHVWQRPEFDKRAAHWAIVCDECCRVSEIYQFEMDERELLIEANAEDQVHLAPTHTLSVGFFCCGPCPEAVALIGLLNAERSQRPLASQYEPDNYPLVLQVFKAIRAGNSEANENLRVQLRELHSSFAELRTKYRMEYSRRNVEIEYSGLIAEAYLLGYVPGYINQARKALELAFDGMQEDQRLALRSRRLSIELHLFDWRTTGWSQTRNGLLDFGCKQKWPGQLNIKEHQFDLHNVHALLEYQEILKSLDLAMFQNFDNEIGSLSTIEGARAAETITKIADQLPSGAQLVLSDLAGSDKTQKQLQEHWIDLGIGEVVTKQMRSKGFRRNIPIHPRPKDGPLKRYFFSQDLEENRIPRTGLPSINILVLNRA